LKVSAVIRKRWPTAPDSSATSSHHLRQSLKSRDGVVDHVRTCRCCLVPSRIVVSRIDRYVARMSSLVDSERVVVGHAGMIQPTRVNAGTAPDKRLINPVKCWDLFWRPELAVEPAHRFRFHWVRIGLSVLDKAALYASQRPVFKAESPRRNVLDLHAGSALWTAGPHGMARR
jgi:hypothetical protein